MRIAAGRASKGSRLWLQRAVEWAPHVLQPAGLPALEWLSPLASDGWAEYQDAAFLDLLGLGRLSGELASFWPRRGPVWDGLARAGNTVVLVEAKSHVPEFLSSPCAATSRASLTRIDAAFDRTRARLGADDRADWKRVFFQYANRLAHLCWLDAQGVEACLLFVSFVGDTEMKGPAASSEWVSVFRAADHALGLPAGHPLRHRVLHVFPDVAALRG